MLTLETVIYAMALATAMAATDGAAAWLSHAAESFYANLVFIFGFTAGAFVAFEHFNPFVAFAVLAAGGLLSACVLRPFVASFFRYQRHSPLQ